MSYNHTPKEKLAAIAASVKGKNLSLQLDVEAVVAILERSGLFDGEYYLVTYPDVRAAGINPIKHYVETGWKEDRNPNLWFETAIYRQENPDLDTALNPFLHYILAGFAEGRRPNSHALKRRARLIVSLAPEPDCFATIDACLQSLLRQSKKADKIIVQLSRHSFLGKQFTFNFIEWLDKGIELRWCDNWRQYNALIPTLIDYPDDIIVSCSAKYSYKKDFLSRLYDAWQANPFVLTCCHGSGITLEGNEAKFRMTPAGETPGPSSLIVPHAAFGLLLPPKTWSDLAVDKDIFMRLAPFNADLWYWVMSLVANRKILIINDNLPLITNAGRHLDELKIKLEKMYNNIQEDIFKLVYRFRDNVGKSGLNFYEHILKPKVKTVYKKMTGLDLDLENCRTLNEKIQYLKIYNDLPIKSPLADKYRARSYLRKIIGDQYLVKLLGVYRQFDEINFSLLPDKFVLKPNHASGRVIIVNDKSKFDKEEARKKFERWMHLNYCINSLEMNYFSIKPLIVIEEYLGDDITDYRFFCTYGNVFLVYTDVNKFSDHRSNIYSPDWQLQNCTLRYKNTDYAQPKPVRFEEMTLLAQKLSRDFKFVRIDFFLINDKLYIGELTFYPTSGYVAFSPEEANYNLGRLIP